MQKGSVLLGVAAMIAFLSAIPAVAHVPYFEHRDLSEEKPFVVLNGIEQSIAVYAWLDPGVSDPAGDIDVFAFEVETDARVYLEILVPVCPEYEYFTPWFALVGPGLPLPNVYLPFDLPPGYGALIMDDVAPGEPRNSFFEPFGGKSYYEGPVFDQELAVAGAYYVYVWDPYVTGGDYVMVMGAEEIWRPRDIIRGLFYTPLIRQGKELHVDCSP